MFSLSLSLSQITYIIKLTTHVHIAPNSFNTNVEYTLRDGLGRHYPGGHLSLVYFRGILRQTSTFDANLDCDIQNSHFTFAKYLASFPEHHVDAPWLRWYGDPEFREVILKEVQRQHAVLRNRSETKQFLLGILNGGDERFHKLKRDEWESFKKSIAHQLYEEVETLKKAFFKANAGLLECFQDYKQKTYQRDLRRWNERGVIYGYKKPVKNPDHARLVKSCFSRLLQDAEDTVVRRAMKYVQSVCTELPEDAMMYMYDGFEFLNPFTGTESGIEKKKEELLKGLNAHILELSRTEWKRPDVTPDLNVSFEIKPHKKAMRGLCKPVPTQSFAYIKSQYLAAFQVSQALSDAPVHSNVDLKPKIIDLTPKMVDNRLPEEAGELICAQNTSILITPMGTGKTYQLCQSILKLLALGKIKSVVVSSYRVCLCRKLLEDLNKLLKGSLRSERFDWYRAIDGEIRAVNNPFVVVVVNSFKRVHGNYDMIVFDELSYSLDQVIAFASDALRLFRFIKRHVENCSKFVAMDAFLPPRHVEWILECRFKHSSNSSPVNPKPVAAVAGSSDKAEADESDVDVIAPETPVIIKCTKSPITSRVEWYGYGSFRLKIVECLRAKKRMVIPTNNKGWIDDTLFPLIAEYWSDARILKMVGGDDVGSVDDWVRHDIVVYSPVIEAGVSQDEQHFDVEFVYLISSTNAAASAIQMSFRSRHLIDDLICVCVVPTAPTNNWWDREALKIELYDYEQGFVVLDPIREIVEENDELEIVIDHTRRRHQSKNNYLQRMVHYLTLQDVEYAMEITTVSRDDTDAMELLDEIKNVVDVGRRGKKLAKAKARVAELRETTLLSSVARSALQDKFVKTKNERLTLLHYDIHRLMCCVDSSFEGIGSMFDYELVALSDPKNHRYIEYELKKLSQIRERGLTDVSQFDVTKYVETEFGYAKSAAYDSGAGPKAKDRDEVYNQFAALQFIESIFGDFELVPSDNIPGQEYLGNWFEMNPSECGAKIRAFYQGNVGLQLQKYQIITKAKRVTYSTKVKWERQDVTRNINSRLRPINRKLITNQLGEKKKKTIYCFESVLEYEVNKRYEEFESELVKNIASLEPEDDESGTGPNDEAIEQLEAEIKRMEKHDEKRKKYRWNVIKRGNMQLANEEEEDEEDDDNSIVI